MFCFAVAICDLVHDVDAIHGLCWLLTASGNICSFTGTTRISEKNFQMLLAVKEVEI